MDSLNIKNIDEIKKVENMLKTFSKTKFKIDIGHISLVEAQEKLIKRKDFIRIYNSLIDISINLHLVYSDLHDFGVIHNRYFSKDKIEGGSILDNYLKFEKKLEMHRYLNSFILKYRALLDKIMGFLVLYYKPKEYDSFSGAKKKLLSFKKISKQIEDIDPTLFDNLIEIINKFDENFRTSEAHQVGEIKKWSLSMKVFGETPLVELIGYWNFLNNFFANDFKKIVN